MESEKNRFTIIPKEQRLRCIRLDLDPLFSMDTCIELTGKTEAGARVMVNGHEVPMVGSDGSFSLLYASDAEPGKA